MEQVVYSCNLKCDHIIDGGQVLNRKFKSHVKDEVNTDPTKTNFEVYVNTFVKCTGDIHSETGDVLPRFRNATSRISKVEAKIVPPNPVEIEEIEIPDELKYLKDGNSFILIDCLEDRMIIFAREDMFIRFCNQNIIYMDGTFKTCPKQFAQLYTIHCFLLGQMFSVIFALLPDKRQETCERLLSLLEAKAIELGLDLRPMIVQTDFEMGMMNAVRSVFPLSRIRGCYFHYVKCIWEYIKKNVYVKFAKNDLFKTVYWKISALPVLLAQYFRQAKTLIYDEFYFLADNNAFSISALGPTTITLVQERTIT